MKISLTDLEKKILWAFNNNEYDCSEDGSHTTWVFTVIDNAGLTGKVASGVISSLVKKELMVVNVPTREDRRMGETEASCYLTTAGEEACAEYDLLGGAAYPETIEGTPAGSEPEEAIPVSLSDADLDRAGWETAVLDALGSRTMATRAILREFPAEDFETAHNALRRLESKGLVRQMGRGARNAIMWACA